MNKNENPPIYLLALLGFMVCWVIDIYCTDYKMKKLEANIASLEATCDLLAYGYCQCDKDCGCKCKCTRPKCPRDCLKEEELPKIKVVPPRHCPPVKENTGL